MNITKPMDRDAQWEIKRSLRHKSDSLAREYGYGANPSYTIVATVSLHKLKGNDSPHFSATAEVLNMRKHGDNRIQACGCLHDDILKHFPSFAPVVLVHGSDHNGVPMHAVDNAIYWAGFSTWADGTPISPRRGKYDNPELFEVDTDGFEWSPVRLASHLRVSVAEAREIRAYALMHGAFDREAFARRIVMLEPKWLAEAEAAWAVITKVQREQAAP